MECRRFTHVLSWRQAEAGRRDGGGGGGGGGGDSVIENHVPTPVSGGKKTQLRIITLDIGRSKIRGCARAGSLIFSAVLVWRVAFFSSSFPLFTAGLQSGVPTTVEWRNANVTMWSCVIFFHRGLLSYSRRANWKPSHHPNTNNIAVVRGTGADTAITMRNAH